MIGVFLIGAFLISGLLFVNRNKFLNYSLVGIFIALLWSLVVYSYSHKNAIDLIYFKMDALAILMLIVIGIISVPAAYHSYVYIAKHNESPKIRALYFSAIVLLLTAMSAAYLSNHIAVTWIFVELTTLTASILIYHHRNERALEGTWKYIFICAISITFVFIGILFLSIALQQAGTDEMSFDALLEKAKILNPFWMRLAFLFIFTGFTAKLGLVPMYTAGIDAKDKAPAPAGALFSTVLVNVGFVSIFRFYVIISNTSIHQWANSVIMIAAFLSIFVATVYMVRVKNIKRIFAYSGVEHMGLVMLGIAAGGIGYYAALLHIILHAFVKSTLFFQFSQVHRVFKSKSIYDVGNYFKYNPTGAIVLLIGFIFATAMPPSGLFVSEFLIFRSLFEGHHILILFVVLALLTMIIWAFGKNIFKILFSPPIGFSEKDVERIKPAESTFQFILLGLSVYLGMNPPAQFVDLIREAITNLPHAL